MRRKLIPEVVLLLVAGIVIGPYALDLAKVDSEIELLRELGLGMLFLLAGYEIDRDELTGRGGRRALITWLICLSLAFAVVGGLAAAGLVHSEIAVAIALTSTALGTLLPILKDRGLVETPVGRAVLNHGAIGEIGPVIAMACCWVRAVRCCRWSCWRRSRPSRWWWRCSRRGSCARAPTCWPSSAAGRTPPPRPRSGW